MDATGAVNQASVTLQRHLSHAVGDLCDVLNIERDDPKRREKLAPFAPVLAAMVAAAAADFDAAAHTSGYWGDGEGTRIASAIVQAAQVIANGAGIPLAPGDGD